MGIYESGEMYLETIYVLGKEKETVRAIDIAERLNFSKPSVSRALKILSGNNLVEIENNKISLTATGIEKAKSLFERHQILTNLLVKMGVEKVLAEEDACRIEHVISPTAFNAIKEYLEKNK